MALNEPGLCLRIVEHLSLTIRSSDLIEAAWDGHSSLLSRAAFDVLIAFAQPTTLAELLRFASDGHTRTILSEVDALVHAGVLECVPNAPHLNEGASVLDPLKEGSGALECVPNGPFDDDASIEDLLASELSKRNILSLITDPLTEGRAIIIPHAFHSDIAEEVYSSLATRDDWVPQSFYVQERPFFQFRHQGFYGTNLPECVHRLAATLNSTRTRNVLGATSGADCNGGFEAGAALHGPGDYSLPHNDDDGHRAISFVWYLSKSWRPEWGGHFVWCPTGAMINPGFNTLVLFKVSRSSLHFVSPVSRNATGKRIAIAGFWKRLRTTTDGRPEFTQVAGVRLSRGLYDTREMVVADCALVL